MALLSAQSITLAYGGPPLLDGVTFTVDRGERICLVGRNGEGKSTLLRLLAGEEPPDSGTIATQSGTKVATLPQVFPASRPGTIRSVIEEDHPGVMQDPEKHRTLDRLISQLDLDPEATFDALSGGEKRRVLLTSALAEEPDLLLLDEPTNHLDLVGIEWLERWIGRFPGAVLFITHDRAFLRRTATRILELDRGTLRDWICDYDTFLRRRETELEAEEKAQALFDKKLAQEERWIRQGIQARRTRNEGRVRALKAMRRERAERRERVGSAKLQLEEAQRSGVRVLKVTGLNHAYGDTPIVRNLDLQINRGDKIGIIGPNGCGKTTLLRLLLGKLDPDQGTVEHGTRLETVFFDQHREELDEEKNLMDNVGQGSDHVTLQGKRRHVISYLEDFLFSPSRSRTPVKVLSGGERNRLLLAKMFTQPGNVLIMDEPTNDLDIETLELLESLLVDYAGTLLLVSHDRNFLDHVVTSTLAYDGDGCWVETPGGYEDWMRQRGTVKKADTKATPAKAPQAPRKKPLNGKEKRELAALPEQMEALEQEMETLGQEISTPEFYARPEAEQQEVRARLDALPQEVETMFARWEELEERA